MSEYVRQDGVLAGPARLPSGLPPGQPGLQYEDYETVDALMADLNAWGRGYGLGFVKRRPSNYINGLPTRMDIICDRGHQRASRATIKRTTTSKTGCEWSAVAKILVRGNKRWIFEIRKTVHNHEAEAGRSSLATHQVHRGLTEPMKAYVNNLSATPGIQPRDIAASLGKQFPHTDVVLTLADINNFRAR